MQSPPCYAVRLLQVGTLRPRPTEANAKADATSASGASRTLRSPESRSLPQSPDRRRSDERRAVCRRRAHPNLGNSRVTSTFPPVPASILGAHSPTHEIQTVSCGSAQFLARLGLRRCPLAPVVAKHDRSQPKPTTDPILQRPVRSDRSRRHGLLRQSCHQQRDQRPHLRRRWHHAFGGRSLPRSTLYQSLRSRRHTPARR